MLFLANILKPFYPACYGKFSVLIALQLKYNIKLNQHKNKQKTEYNTHDLKKKKKN